MLLQAAGSIKKMFRGLADVSCSICTFSRVPSLQLLQRRLGGSRVVRFDQPWTHCNHTGYHITICTAFYWCHLQEQMEVDGGCRWLMWPLHKGLFYTVGIQMHGATGSFQHLQQCCVSLHTSWVNLVYDYCHSLCRTAEGDLTGRISIILLSFLLSRFVDR